jgi:hypothetical protein
VGQDSERDTAALLEWLRTHQTEYNKYAIWLVFLPPVFAHMCACVVCVVCVVLVIRSCVLGGWLPRAPPGEPPACM